MRTLEQHLDAMQGPKRLLALDGGGVKGILTLGMLEVLEAQLQKRAHSAQCVLSDYFDLIGGTSTGAIIATALALGMSVPEIISMYEDMGPKVFRKTGRRGVWRSRYDVGPLRKALWPVLDKKTLGSRQLKTGLALHAKRIDTGSAWVLTNNPQAKYFDPPNSGAGSAPNKDYRLIDLVMASAAAPTFFDEVQIAIAYDTNGKATQKGYFVDGALAGFNNPSVQMLLTALVPAYGFGWRPGPRDLMLASFGTGFRRQRFDGARFKNKWSADRGIQALRSMILDTQSQGVQLLQAFSEPVTPWTINSEVGNMRGQCVGGQPMLDYQRVDVELDPKLPAGKDAQSRSSIEHLLDRDIDAKRLEDLDTLDHGDRSNMALLLDIGRATGHKYVSKAWPDPAFDLQEWAPKGE